MQLDEIGEDHVAGRLQQADMARGGDGIGALIVGDGVGEQHLVVLGDLDMTFGDDEAELVVVLHLVGAEQHRAFWPWPRSGPIAAAGMAAAASSALRHRTTSAAHPRQPSSRCSSMLAPRSQLTPAGVQAASATGIVAERPRAKTMSDMK